VTDRRRRGTELTTAIYRATLDELARTSFDELTFERIAVAAGTGKAALYRRWSTPAELVTAALADPDTGLGGHLDPPATGTLRGDLVALLTGLAAALDEPRGQVLRPLVAQRHRHPGLYESVERVVLAPHLGQLMDVLRAAAERGEAWPERVTERVAGAGPKLVLMEAWQHGPVGRDDVEAIVDEVLLPILGREPIRPTDQTNAVTPSVSPSSARP
jgi:AcrR family transcriptional regulator